VAWLCFLLPVSLTTHSFVIPLSLTHLGHHLLRHFFVTWRCSVERVPMGRRTICLFLVCCRYLAFGGHSFRGDLIALPVCLALAPWRATGHLYHLYQLHMVAQVFMCNIHLVAHSAWCYSCWRDILWFLGSALLLPTCGRMTTYHTLAVPSHALCLLTYPHLYPCLLYWGGQPIVGMWPHLPSLPCLCLSLQKDLMTRPMTVLN